MAKPTCGNILSIQVLQDNINYAARDGKKNPWAHFIVKNDQTDPWAQINGKLITRVR
jgi:heat shock protein HspQ